MRLNFISVNTTRNGYSSKTDEELISEFLVTKDMEIISQLFDRYIHLVYASCSRYYKDHNKAKDAAMEIFEMLDQKIERYEIHCFKSWLYKVVQNHCLAVLRKKKHEELFEPSDFLYFKNVENEPEMYLNNETDNRTSILQEGLHKLKDGQKLCLELMYLFNKSYKEIALETGYSEKMVKSYIQNGKRNLKNFFDDLDEKFE